MKPNSSSARSRALVSHVASSWHGQRQGGGLLHRPAAASQRAPWMSRCAGFHVRSLNRCILPSADSRRRIIVGAWLSARLAR
jgi:hypothetical protein